MSLLRGFRPTHANLRHIPTNAMNSRTKFALITLASAAGLWAASAQTLLYQNDFSDPSKPLTALNWTTFALKNEQLVLTSTRTSATDPNNLVTSTGGVEPLI